MHDEMDYQVEDDLRTLRRAKEITQDPQRMAKVRGMLDDMESSVKGTRDRSGMLSNGYRKVG